MRPEKRILVVDDDDAIRSLVATVLRRRGLRVDQARNGTDAIELMSQSHYGLVVLDLMMPRMSGYEVLEHLATLAAIARPLVLVLTASLTVNTFDPSFVIGTLHKPFDIELLVDTVTAALSAITDSRPADDVAPANWFEDGHNKLPDKTN